MSENKSIARTRDRAATEAALVKAARAVLAEAGFQGLGVNAIARAAGCDKQLIYRYFGGVEGLVDAIGAQISEDLRLGLQPLLALGQPASYQDLVERLLLGFLELLRADPLMQKIMAWEIAEPSALVQRLTLARSKGLMLWIAQSRGTLAPREGLDVPATNAVLLAAIQHLVLAGATAGQFAGLPLKTPSDWDRVRAVIKCLIGLAYGGD